MTANTPLQALDIQTFNLKKAALYFRAINHPLRQKMLQLLHKKERMPVTDVYVKLKLEQSVASQHLAILRRARLVQTERESKQIFYSVNYEQLHELHKIAHQLLEKK